MQQARKIEDEQVQAKFLVQELQEMDCAKLLFYVPTSKEVHKLLKSGNKFYVWWVRGGVDRLFSDKQMRYLRKHLQSKKLRLLLSHVQFDHVPAELRLGSKKVANVVLYNGADLRTVLDLFRKFMEVET